MLSIYLYNKNMNILLNINHMGGFFIYYEVVPGYTLKPVRDFVHGNIEREFL